MTQSAPVDLDLELMRAASLLDADPSAAAHHARRILSVSPGHPEASLLWAAASRMRGDPAAAAVALEALDEAQRNTAFMQLELGRAYAAAGRTAAALTALRRAVALDAGLADGWRELAALAFAVGDLRAGDAAHASYSALTADPPELNDALIALADNRLDAAESLLRQRLASAPGDAAARFALANLLYQQNRQVESLALLERLLDAAPHRLDYLHLKAQALRLVGRSDEAVALMEAAVAHDPRQETAWLLMGHLLREVGRQSAAIDAYRRALEIRPGSGGAYWSLANLKTFRLSDADLEAMQRHLAAGKSTAADLTHLEFALGKALEDAQRYQASFEHYARGNARHRATLDYDATATTAIVRRSMAVCDAAFFADRRGWGCERNDPIFIIGLPRSGSTLVEQILASHSQVEGTRELPNIPALALELTARPQGAGRATAGQGYPWPVAALDSAEIAGLAARYLAETQVHRPRGRPRFVDKMLNNFAHLGLIQLMFPRAAIVDVRRHPLGCSFSCYKQLFARGLAHTYDLRELGLYYRDYAELLAHVDAVLPDRVHRVYYERLVADPEGEVRRLLEYCGLPFEAECLKFHENRRVVQTISSEQVRRPIYADAVDQWVHYQPWLRPLEDTVGNWVATYPGSGRSR